MKSLRRLVLFALVVVMASAMLTFPISAKVKSYLVRDFSVDSNSEPVWSDNLFAVNNTVYDSEGNVFVQLPSDEQCVSLTDDCVISTGADGYVHVYCITGGSVVETYSCIGTRGMVVPFKRFEILDNSCQILHEFDYATIHSSTGLQIIGSTGDAGLEVECDYGLYIGGNIIAAFQGDILKLINLNGTIISSGDYDDAYTFNEGRACVQKDDKVGYINPDGELIIQIKYTYGTMFMNGYAAVIRDGKSYMIDEDGNEFLGKDYPPEYFFANTDEMFVSAYTNAVGKTSCNLYDISGNLISSGFTRYAILSDNHVFLCSDDYIGNLYTDNGILLLSGVLDVSVDTDTEIIVAQKDGTYYEYDFEGNVISALSDTYASYYVTYKNLFVVTPDGSCTMIDNGGRELVPYIHSGFCGTEEFSNGNQASVFYNENASNYYTLYFMRLSRMPFNDVREVSWFHDAVQYAYGNGLFSGTSNSTFDPDAVMTRAMLVTVLWRMSGSPIPVSSYNPFADVPQDKWYSDAVLWAVENNIVNGITPTEFAPENGVTREQIATLVYRYADYKGYDLSGSGDLTQFTDSGRIGSFAEVPMSWAVSKSLISGRGNGVLAPQGGATRAEVATILMRLIKVFESIR